MAKDYTTLSVSKETAKVYEHLKGTGQSFDGFLRDMAEKQTGKDFKTLLEEAEGEQ